MAATVFSLQQVFYSYHGGERVLQDVSLQIRAGEAVALLGANGCGKSTLQKILAGLIFPDEGQLTAFDRNITSQSMNDKQFAALFRQKVGFVFQNSDVQLFCSDVLSEIMFGLEAMGLSFEEAEQRAWETLRFIGIEHLAARLPHHLSGGEKKKTAIAAVLAVNPEVLILDEPTNGLDPKTQRWMVGLLNELHSHGKTLIIATHHLDLVSQIANRVVIMSEQHAVLADGTPSVILNDRGLLLTANLIDECEHVHTHFHDGHFHIHR